MDREGQWGYQQLIVVEVTFFNGVDTDMLPVLQLKKKTNKPYTFSYKHPIKPSGLQKRYEERD